MDPGMQSMCQLQASELFPKKPTHLDDPNLLIPHCLIHGEYVAYLGQCVDGVLALSNYRMFLQLKGSYRNIPLGLIDTVEIRDLLNLHIFCKDARLVRCGFLNGELCAEWLRRFQAMLPLANNIDTLFSYTYHAWARDEGNEEFQQQMGIDPDINHLTLRQNNFEAELNRLEFDLQGAWRITSINKNFRFCHSYPEQLVVPACITDDELRRVATFRSTQRIPAVVWRNRVNGAVIARCSQPEVGWLGWRSPEDEELLKSISYACAANSGSGNGRGTATPGIADFGSGPPSSLELVPTKELYEKIEKQGTAKKVLILDARSYTTAVANRARGGGCECPEYYPMCEIQFMSLANIHSVRKSFQQLRLLCSTVEQSNWYSQLESTKWMQHMAGLIKAAVNVVTAIEDEGRPVVVHCSDGWDRTPQIVALAEILLDPHYRTIEGFQTMVEREWLDFGHKFGDRCGQGLKSDDLNERCPVFLQWLDCVHQFLHQFPCNFEFNQGFLIKLAHHTYSQLFGTFLCNSAKERNDHGIKSNTYSIWKFLRSTINQPYYRNSLYVSLEQVMIPSYNVGDLSLWKEMYIGDVSSVTHQHLDISPDNSVIQEADEEGPMITSMTKTKSYDDLINLAEHSEEPQRRLSDPSISDSITESHLQQLASCLSIEPKDDDVKTRPQLDNLSVVGTTPSKQCLVENVAVEESVNGDVDVATAVAEAVAEDVAENGITEDVKSEDNPTQKDVIANGHESENEDSESLSENKSDGVCNGVLSKVGVKSIESSTDTLVAEAGVILGEPVQIQTVANGMDNAAVLTVTTEPTVTIPEKVYSTLSAVEDSVARRNTTEMNKCQVCIINKKFLENSNAPILLSGDNSLMWPHTSSSSSRASVSQSMSHSTYSTPFHSRTPSTGLPATPNEDRHIDAGAHVSATALRFDVDGLAPPKDTIQERVNEIIGEYKMQIDLLKRELQMTRTALIKQVGHQCSQSVEPPDDSGSLPDSVGSSDQPSVGHESQYSDFSWETVEEKDTMPTLWVPDFAVTSCMGCDHQFWMGRRKHHCRNCGRIFCSDCSEYTMPIPSEQLYQPVRVCAACFRLLSAMHTTANGNASCLNGNQASVSNGNHEVSLGDLPTTCVNGSGYVQSPFHQAMPSLPVPSTSSTVVPVPFSMCKQQHCVANKMSKPVVTAAST